VKSVRRTIFCKVVLTSQDCLDGGIGRRGGTVRVEFDSDVGLVTKPYYEAVYDNTSLELWIQFQLVGEETSM
jgi:hypothetical protein